MIEFIFGTLIQILIIQTDINDYFKIKKWDLRFWKYAFINGLTCHIFFQFVFESEIIIMQLIYVYISIIILFIMCRKIDDWIMIKDTIRFKVILNYIYIGVSSMIFIVIYNMIFENLNKIYQSDFLFYLLGIPMFAGAIIIRKVVKGIAKYKSENKSKIDADGNVTRSCGNTSSRNVKRRNIFRLARYYTRRRFGKNLIFNLTGYSCMLIFSIATNTLIYYVAYLTFLKAGQVITENKLFENGYYIKHCSVWKDCFSSTHFIYFGTLYFVQNSELEFIIILSVVIISNFETLRRTNEITINN